jgi:type II secretory pathway component PulK
MRPPGDRRGFVLVAALWLLVALAGVGLHAALTMQTERLAMANTLDEVRAREAALAGTEYARSRLTAALFDREEELRAQALEAAARRGATPGPAAGRRNVARTREAGLDPWRDPEGLLEPELAFGDARFRLEVHDVHARINLNTAEEPVLRNFFSRGLGLDDALADRITQAILDWTDEDDLPRVGGAEREEYLRQGRAILPPNRFFASVDELRHVLGVTPEIFEAARPWLTVIRAGSRINVNSAPAPVLRALPGVSEAGAEEILRLREAGIYPRNVAQLLALLPPSVAASIEAQGDAFSGLASTTTAFLEIVVTGQVDGSPTEARVRTVVTRGNSGARVVWRGIEE